MKRELVKELHKQAYKPKKCRKVISLGLDDTWSIDLVDMRYIDGESNAEKQLELNDGYQYIFMCIDLFSRYGWAVPMKNKTTTEAWKAFSKILAGGRKPKKIWADQGGEFHSDFWEDKLAKDDITLYYTGSERKAVMVERLNKTIKTWMWQEFTYYDDVKKWIDILPKLIDRYNKRVHSAIGMKPEEASNLSKKKLNKLAEKQYEGAVGEVGKPKYEVLDYVRISRLKGTFEKGYTQKWSKEIYRIMAIDLNKPIKCHLQDENGEDVTGVFYESELQKTIARPVKQKLTNDIPVYDHRFVKTKSKALYSNIELEVKLDGKKEWVPLNKFLIPVPGERGKRNVHSVAKYVHDNLFEEVWSKI